MAKRYYWLKLPDDWFRQKPIKKLRKIAGGDTYTIIYLKMLLVAIKQDGKLYFDGVEDAFHEELALDIDEDPENVRVTVAYLLSQQLMVLANDDEYTLPEALKLTGSESASAERMRRLRNKKASQSDTDVTRPLRLSDVEKEIEIEKEKRDIKTFCPEPDKSASGPEPATEEPTVDNSAKGIGAAPGNGAKGIGTGAGMMVEKAAGPSPEVFIQLPLNNGTMYDVTRDYVEQNKKLYPAVDVEQELRKMRGWCDANPSNRKTARGVKRFINGWLTREQDRAPRRQTQYPRQGTNRFNNFTPSGTDWNAAAYAIMDAQTRALEAEEGGDNEHPGTE